MGHIVSVDIVLVGVHIYFGAVFLSCISLGFSACPAVFLGGCRPAILLDVAAVLGAGGVGDLPIVAVGGDFGCSHVEIVVVMVGGPRCAVIDVVVGAMMVMGVVWVNLCSC